METPGDREGIKTRPFRRRKKDYVADLTYGASFMYKRDEDDVTKMEGLSGLKHGIIREPPD